MRSAIAIIGMLIPVAALAAGLNDVGSGSADPIWAQACTILPYCGQGASGIAIMTGIVIRFIMVTIGSVAVLIILYASIRLVTSGGNEETVRKAWKEMIFYAALGLLFAILADTIVNYVLTLVGSIAAS